MTANQLYGIVNDIASESLGTAAITVKDTATLVSLGDVVLSSATNKDAFYNTLIDRCGRTVVAIRKYKASKRSVKKDDMEWGIVMQKISYKRKSSVENASWEKATQANPFDVEVSTEAVQKLFSVLGTYSYEDSIPDYQLFTAFTDATAMAAFISGIMINMENDLALADENLCNLAVDTAIAGVLIKGNAVQKRNLLKEYNTLQTAAGGTAIASAADALMNKDFLKYASREINKVTKQMKKMSETFNSEGMPRFTPEDKLVVEILSDFASATDSYLQSDTYHNELVKLPNYEEVPYWQGVGTAAAAYTTAELSRVNISNIHLATDENATGTINKNFIVGFVHDYDMVSSIITRFRDGSIYNPRVERTNYFKKADTGYAVDLSENAVVFYLDADEA